MTPITYPFSSKVVGVSFVDDYPGNLLALATALDPLDPIGEESLFEAFGFTEPGPFHDVTLVRNPANEYDANAIEVHVDGKIVGHLPKDVAARLAPSLDRGEDWAAQIERVDVDPDHTDRPGLTIHVTPPS